jgi:hypothetical protein
MSPALRKRDLGKLRTFSEVRRDAEGAKSCPHGRNSSPDRCSQCQRADVIRWPVGAQLALPTVRRIRQRRRRV